MELKNEGIVKDHGKAEKRRVHEGHKIISSDPFCLSVGYSNRCNLRDEQKTPTWGPLYLA